MSKRALVRQESHETEETLSVLLRTLRSTAPRGLALIGAIATTVLVGASAIPAGAQRLGAERQRAVLVQAEATTQVGETVTTRPVRDLEQVNGPSSIATTGSPAQFRLKEERDRLLLRFTDQLVYLESVFANAMPGSPAQFRAHEEAESVRERLRSIGRG